MSNPFIAEMRSLYKRIDDLDRRMHTMVLSGTVAETQGNRVRLELMGNDPRTGKPFLSPWVQLQDAAGGTASNMPVKKGDPMRLLSPAGIVGEQSLAIRDSHTDAAPNPAQDNELVLQFGDAEIRMSADGLVLRKGDTAIVLTGTTVSVTGARLEHNSRNIGSTHTHSGIERGGANTNPPNP